MRVLGIIPARGGSKGVPGKNIRPLAGKPLLLYTAQAAQAAKSLSMVCLSTDSEDIADVGRKSGLSVPFLRPASLALDASPTIDTVIHAVEYYATMGEHFDAVCLLQPTCPFREKGFIDAAMSKFIQSGADSLISVREVPHEFNPHWVFERGNDGNLRIATGEKNIIPRRQELPEAFHRDGSLYIAKMATILESRTLLGESISYVISRGPHANIDTAADWQKAEDIASRL